MFCTKCGAPITPGKNVCEKCGAVVSENMPSAQTTGSEKVVQGGTYATQPADVNGMAQPGMNPNYQAGMNAAPQPEMNPNYQTGMNAAPQPVMYQQAPAKKGKGKLIAIICIAAVFVMIAAIGVIVFLSTYKPKVDLNEYIVFNFEGYDGYGKPSFSFDTEKLEKDHGRLKYKSKKANDDLTPAEAIALQVDGYFDESWELSNGDSVMFSWSISEYSIEDMVKCDVEFHDIEVEVTGLEEVPTFDPFEDITVVFSGVNGRGQAEIVLKEGATFDTYDYDMDYRYDLSNGDTFTVSVGSDDYYMESYVKNYGKMPSVTEKQYEVTGLARYAKELSEIPETTMKEIEENIITDLKKIDYDDGVTLKSISVVGNYFMYPKNPDSYSYSGNNMLYTVLKLDMSVELDGSAEPYEFPIYMYIEYDDILINDDGICDFDVYDYSTGYHSEHFDIMQNGRKVATYYAKGYTDEKSLYNALVESDGQKYYIESNMEE